MSYAVLYNMFTCWMVTVLAAMALPGIFKRFPNNLGWRAYGWFWFCGACLWLLAGLRLLAYYHGLPRLDRAFFYGDEVFVALQMEAGCVFLCDSRGASRRVTLAAAGFVALCGLLFLIMFFSLGITATVPTEWASEHEIPRAAFLAFLPAYLFCMALMVYSVGADVWARLRTGAWADRHRLLGTGGILIYSLAGVLDVRGILAGWHLLLIRVVYLSAVMTAFWIGRADRMRVVVVRGHEGD